MSQPRVLVLDASDNVAVAVAALEAGAEVARVHTLEPIPVGHKVALREIAEGGAVRKYGEVIGVATRPIAPGAHVHVHNVVSARLPGQGT